MQLKVVCDQRRAENFIRRRVCIGVLRGVCLAHGIAAQVVEYVHRLGCHGVRICIDLGTVDAEQLFAGGLYADSLPGYRLCGGHRFGDRLHIIQIIGGHIAGRAAFTDHDMIPAVAHVLKLHNLGTVLVPA